MPGRVTQLDSDQIIADLLIAKRQASRALTGVQMPTWQHDSFTAPATYQLTYIPYGINALADNGTMLSEGTDYTVDYTTGLITFGTGRTSGHTIFVSYVTTGDLTALSGPVDYGALLDTFTRANSSTSLAGGPFTWQTQGLGSGATATWGISSNQAEMFSTTSSDSGIAYVATGNKYGTLSLDHADAGLSFPAGAAFWVAFGSECSPNLMQWYVATRANLTLYSVDSGGTLHNTVVHSWSPAGAQSGNITVTLTAGQVVAVIDGGSSQTVSLTGAVETTRMGMYVHVGDASLLDNFSWTP